jgi:Cu+-exporting ATPase
MNEKIVTLPVEGMTCGNCVRRVEQALYNVEGVASAKAELASNSATVKIVENQASAEDLISAVRRIGYHLREEKMILSISGMTCFNCTIEVDLALSKVVGVTSVNISLMTEKAVVSFIPGIATMQDFKAAVAKTGKRVADSAEVERKRVSRRYRVNTDTPQRGCCN